MRNITDLSNLNFTTNLSFIKDQARPTDYLEIVRSICDYIPINIVNAFVWVLFFWFFARVMMPIAEKYYVESVSVYKKFIIKVFDHAYSFIETGALLYTILILIVAYTQHGYTNFSLQAKVVLSFMAFFIVIIDIVKIKEFIEKKRKNKEKK